MFDAIWHAGMIAMLAWCLWVWGRDVIKIEREHLPFKALLWSCFWLVTTFIVEVGEILIFATKHL